MREFFLRLRRLFFFERPRELILIFLFFLLGIFFIFLPLINSRYLVKPTYGGVYREGFFENFDNLNPLYPQKEIEKVITNIVYPPLIEFYQGKISSKYIKNFFFSSDFLTLQIELKDELKWSDGSKITTDDILFSFESIKKYGLPEYKRFFENSELKIIDEKKAEFKLKNNDNYFIYNLSRLSILPHRKLSQYNLPEIPYEVYQIGSGPFVLDKIEEKPNLKIITLKRNQFFNKKPFLDQVVFYIYPSAKDAFDALLLKNIDGLAGINYFKLPINIAYHYQVKEFVLPRIVGIFFNSKNIPQEKILFLDNNINRREIIQKIFQGRAEESRYIFSPKIRKLLALKNPQLQERKFEKNVNISLEDLEITVPVIYFYPDIARYLKEKFNIKISLVEESDINKILEEKNYSAILYGLNFSYPPFLFYFWSQGGLNINNFNDIELEKKFQNLILDPQIKFNEQILQIEERILNNGSNIFLLNPYYLYLINKDIQVVEDPYLLFPEFRFSNLGLWFRR